MDASPPSELTIPLVPDARTFSYPKESAKAQKIEYFPVRAVLTRAWTSDAHMAQYHTPAYPYRLSRDAVTLGCGVVMVIVAFDIDCAEAHRGLGSNGDMSASDEWWLAELPKLEALRRDFPGAFIYRTRSGYRIVYVLPEPRVLRSLEDAKAWTSDY